MSTVDVRPRPARRPAPPAPRHAYPTRGSAAVAVASAPAPDHRPGRRVERRPDHLRVVGPTERTRRRLSPAAAVVLTACVFATLFAVAIAQTVLVQGQVRLDALDQQLTTEQARYQELRQEVAQLESPDRIVAAAHQQGMVTPDDLRYLQPLASDPTAVGPAAGDDTEANADPAETAGPDLSWPAIKPLLEAAAP